MKTTVLNGALLAAALGLAAVLSAGAQGTTERGQGTTGRGQGTIDRDSQMGRDAGRYHEGSHRYTSSDYYSSTSGKPQKANKASKLIGMEVKNQSGERLGTVKDVVLDFSSGRAAYCVLEAEGGTAQQSRLHAVPLDAFQLSADGNAVTLNVDKSKLAQAQGFSESDYPSLDRSVWGAEPFLHRDMNKNQMKGGADSIGGNHRDEVIRNQQRDAEDSPQ
jgi:sporulation protein YlmC with PRC-barrel domain